MTGAMPEAIWMGMFKESNNQSSFQLQWELGPEYSTKDTSQVSIYSRLESSQPVSDGEELFLMQVFINEMACWMDIMTTVKYVR